jgi:ABC-type antimicrobial peptide transport system permease subunit
MGTMNFLTTATYNKKKNIAKLVSSHNFPKIDRKHIYRETVFLSVIDLFKILDLVPETHKEFCRKLAN